MATSKAKPERKPVEPQMALELLKSALWYMQSAKFAVALVATSRGLAIVIPGIATNAAGEIDLASNILPVVANDLQVVAKAESEKAAA